MSRDYELAIISHRRPHLIAQQTLPLLTTRGINPAHITVWVSDPDEIRAYTATITPRWPQIDIRPGKPGVPGQHNHISRTYPTGTPILTCDDDLKDVLRLNPATGKLEPVRDIHQLICHGFEQAATHHATLWGVYPTANNLYIKSRPATATGLRFIVGTFFGRLNRPTEQLHTRCKEDYERSLLRWETDGTVLRLDHHTIAQHYGKTPGGVQATTDRTPDTATADINYLTNRWPGAVYLNTRRRSPYPEILLRPQPRNTK